MLFSFTELKTNVFGLQTTLQDFLEESPQIGDNLADIERRNNQIWRDINQFQWNITQLSGSLNTGQKFAFKMHAVLFAYFSY